MCVMYVYLVWRGCSVLLIHMLYSRMTLSEAVLTALLSWILHCGASEDRLGAGSSFNSRARYVFFFKKIFFGLVYQFLRVPFENLI